MKNVGIFISVSGFFGLVGALLPLAKAGTLYFSISNGAGLLPLLYVFPIVIMASGILYHLNRIQKIKYIVVPVSIFGILLSVLGAYAAMEHLSMLANGAAGQMINGLGELSAQMGMGRIKTGDVSIGIGAIIMFVSYVAAGAMTLLKRSI